MAGLKRDGDRAVYNYLDSTEILRPGSEWQVISSARLPRPMWRVRVTTVDNRVLLFGECRQILTSLFHLPHTDPCYRGKS